jgi:hypothetical protein
MQQIDVADSIILKYFLKKQAVMLKTTLIWIKEQGLSFGSMWSTIS